MGTGIYPYTTVRVQRYKGITCCTLPDTSVGSVQHPYNTRSFCEFCKKKYPYPKLLWVLCSTHTILETFVSSVRKKIPLPETSVSFQKKKNVPEISVPSIKIRTRTRGTGATYYT